MKDGKPEKARPGSTTTDRLGRRQKKERTRQLLIDAAIDIVRQEGIEALTTTRLASAAGITQPAFYVHFKNVEHCRQAAAGQLFERLRELQADAQQLAGSLITGLDSLDKQEVISATWEKVLTLALAERRTLETALRYRHDPSSALGRGVREALDRGRSDIARQLGRAQGS